MKYMKPAARFWPSENMKLAAHQKAKRDKVEWSPETRKAYRDYYQKRADNGNFQSPTSEELLSYGVDTTTWNERDSGMWTPKIKLGKDGHPVNPEEMGRLPSFEKRLDIDTGKIVVRPVVNLKEQAIKKKQEKFYKEYKERKKEKIKPSRALDNIKKYGTPRKPASGVNDKKPEWTGRKWDGEVLTKKGWVKKFKKNELTFFNWYNTFILNEHNYSDVIPLGHIHKTLCYLMEKTKRGIYMVPRDHFKTSVLNIGYILYIILEKPEFIRTKGILNVSWSKDLAEVTYMNISHNLESNPLILDFYGYVIDEERPHSAKRMFFKYQPESGAKPGLFCAAFKSGKITGTHPAIVFMDDIMDEPLTEKLMKKFQRVVNKKFIPALGREGRFIITGTIKGWDETNDAYLWLRNKPSFQYYAFPAANKMPDLKKDVKYRVEKTPVINPDTGEPFKIMGKTQYRKKFIIDWVRDEETYQTLYPERYTIRHLIIKLLDMREDQKGTFSDDDFYSEYFLKPCNPAGKYFKRSRFGDLADLGWDPQKLADELKRLHIPVYLWIDPGGEHHHGIAVAIMTYFQNNYILLDCRRLRLSIPNAAKVIANLIIKWNVTHWGVEGNFNQKETYGHTLNREVRNQMWNLDRIDAFTRIIIRNNMGDKMQRISTHVSALLGPTDIPVQFFINKNMQDIEELNMELRTFGIGGDRIKHEYDILDCIASIRIHLFSRGRPFAIAAV